ncbi:MAG TPA: branched-chain amino acid ABC transporter permease/ATP-binding protein [Mycobacteriales bacterium]|nr:branched-chain amino acid ABC transporter permease/ATP-binding protein [Mycobacteriales bacterium]
MKLTERTRPVAAVVGVIGALYLVDVLVLPHLLHISANASGHWESPFPQTILGLVTGMTYGLLGVGLVLIYRTNRIINFAHGNIGAFAAALFPLAVHTLHIPYWIALPPVLLIAGVAGAGAEAIVVRRLRRAPLVMSVVATLGVGQFLALLGLVINPKAGAAITFPKPAGMPTFHLGALYITESYFAMFFLCPAVAIAVALFLRYSRYGIALRCAASNPEAARMAGIFAGRMSSLAWGIAGMMAALTAILVAPTGSFNQIDAFGPSLLLKALVCAVVARMSSIPLALVAGVVLGAVESLVSYNYPNAGVVEAVIFAVIVGALLLQRQRVGRGEEKGSWAAVQAIAPIPVRLRQLWAVRALGPATALIVLAVLALLPAVMSNSNSVKMTAIFGYVVVGFSAGIVTGLAGQLSLGQFGIAAIGGVVSYQVVYRTGSYVEGFVYAGLAAAAVSVVLGLPALRSRGLLLTVTTLAFALLVPDWLIQQRWVLGPRGVDPGRPIVFGHALDTGRAYYYVGLLVLVVAMLLSRNVWSGGTGRLLVAVRDNEDAARAFTIRATVVKLQGFALAGFIAGVGGAMYAHSLALVSNTAYPTTVSIQIMEMVVIGGLSILSGPILGAIVIFGVSFTHLDSFGLAATALGQLLIIMYFPGGMAQWVAPVRDRIVKALGRRAGVDVEAAYLTESGSGAAEAEQDFHVEGEHPAALRPARVRRGGGPVLEASGLVKSFGGVRAVRGVSFQVQRGETLGLIGPNGAGKTTTFELLAGFTRVDAGTVRYHGKDVTQLGPEARAKQGLIRSFQDAALFPTMTVLECVQLSLERRHPTRLFTAIAGFRGQERNKEKLARELVHHMGLDRYRSAQIQTLSTGTRRITEIACLVGLEPEVLLLDEPASGVAQRETEALGALLLQLKADLGLTLVVIEHDIPLIMEISDRIVCMAEGEVIATGAPEIVRSDPRVVESYLGGSLTAIERSGTVAPEPGQKPRRPKKPHVLAGSTP